MQEFRKWTEGIRAICESQLQMGHSQLPFRLYEQLIPVTDRKRLCLTGIRAPRGLISPRPSNGIDLETFRWAHLESVAESKFQQLRNITGI